MDPIDLTADEALALAGELRRVWEAMFQGDPPSELRTDLQKLAPWFGPSAQEARVAERLKQLPAVRIRQWTLAIYDPALVLGTPSTAVVTPEGRLALEELDRKAGDPVRLSLDERMLADLYREWAHSRVLNALARRDGRAGRTRPTALGVVALLMALDAVGADRPLTLDRTMPPTDEEHLREPLRAFAQAISSRGGAVTSPLWSWPLSQAKKRFAGIQQELRSGDVIALWLDPGLWQETCRGLAIELTSRSSVATLERATDACFRLLDGWNAAVSGLSGVRSPPPRRSREEVLAAFRAAAGGGR
jgi:hypothetical protein